MGNLEELRELEKKITHPEAAAAVREAIEASNPDGCYATRLSQAKCTLTEVKSDKNAGRPTRVRPPWRLCSILNSARIHPDWRVIILERPAVLANGKVPALSAQPKLIT